MCVHLKIMKYLKYILEIILRYIAACANRISCVPCHSMVIIDIRVIHLNKIVLQRLTSARRNEGQKKKIKKGAVCVCG